MFKVNNKNNKPTSMTSFAVRRTLNNVDPEKLGS